MRKKKLLINKERLPERCDICHLSDCFDPVNNHCTRCANVNEPKKSIITKPVVAMDKLTGPPVIKGHNVYKLEDSSASFDPANLTLILSLLLLMGCAVSNIFFYFINRDIELAGGLHILKPGQGVLITIGLLISGYLSRDEQHREKILYLYIALPLMMALPYIINFMSKIAR